MTNINQTTVWDLTLRKFQQTIASSAPTPGGGSVTIVSACFGLSLIIMAMEITAKKSDSEQLNILNKKVHDILEVMSKYADKDIEVFNNYMSAFKLPKDSDEQITYRQNTIENCILQATQTPMDAGKYILESLKVSKEALPFIKKSVISDIGAGTAMLFGALNGLLLNVDINLPSINDAAVNNQFRIGKEHMINSALNLYKEISKEVSDIITP